jgi:hypothetical protein
MWKLLESLGVKLQQHSPEVETISSRAAAFRHHYDHAMSAAAELHDMISKSQRDLNDAFTRLRAAVPAAPPSHLITEADEAAPAEENNGRPGKRRSWSSAA